MNKEKKQSNRFSKSTRKIYFENYNPGPGSYNVSRDNTLIPKLINKSETKKRNLDFSI
jgi:hypothetical protein